MELVNGEKKVKLIPYRVAEKVKVFALRFIK